MKINETEKIKALIKDNQYSSALNKAEYILSQDPEEDLKVEIYYLISKIQYALGKNKSALEGILKAKEIAKHLEIPIKKTIDLQIQLAKTLRRNQRKDEALQIYNKLLKEKKEKLHKEILASIYHNLANLYLEDGEFNLAEDLYTKVIAIDKNIENFDGLAHTYSSLGALYYYKGEENQALNFYEKSLELRKELGDVLGIATLSLNIGTIYANSLQNKHAEKHLNDALISFQKLNHNRGYLSSKETLGIMYFNQSNYDKVVEYLAHISRYNIYEITPKIIEKIRILAEAYYSLGDILKAKKLVQKGLEASKKFSDEQKKEILEHLGRLMQLLSQILSDQGQIQQSIEVLNKLEVMGDELNDKKSLMAIYLAQALLNFKLDNKEKAIDYLNRSEKLAKKFSESTLIRILTTRVEMNLSDRDYEQSITNLQTLAKIQKSIYGGLFVIIRTLKLVTNGKLGKINRNLGKIKEKHNLDIIFFQETIKMVLDKKISKRRIDKLYNQFIERKNIDEEEILPTYLLILALFSEVEYEEYFISDLIKTELKNIQNRIVHNQILFEELQERIFEFNEKKWNSEEKCKILDIIALGIMKKLLSPKVLESFQIDFKKEEKFIQEILEIKKKILIDITNEEYEKFILDKYENLTENQNLFIDLFKKLINKIPEEYKTSKEKEQILFLIIIKIIEKTLLIFHLNKKE